MKKYILKNSKQPVEMGQIIQAEKTKKTTFGTIKECITLTVTEDVIPMLIKEGIIEEDGNLQKPIRRYDVPTDINYYISAIGHKLGIDESRVSDILEVLNPFYKAAVFQILLKEVASQINHKPGGFKIPSTKWYISLVDGNVYSTETNNKGHATMFYSKEDAELAKSILKEQLEYMYGKK